MLLGAAREEALEAALWRIHPVFPALRMEISVPSLVLSLPPLGNSAELALPVHLPKVPVFCGLDVHFQGMHLGSWALRDVFESPER